MEPAFCILADFHHEISLILNSDWILNMNPGSNSLHLYLYGGVFYFWMEGGFPFISAYFCLFLLISAYFCVLD